jgi:hypothetical protein
VYVQADVDYIAWDKLKLDGRKAYTVLLVGTCKSFPAASCAILAASMSPA